jgi:hypothetical protein
MAGSIRDRLRTILKIRKPRKPTVDRGSKPNAGAKIISEDFRITVQAGMSADLWAWLRTKGWSEVTFRPDRRRYRDVASTWVSRLIDCRPEERDAVLKGALEHAALDARTRETAQDEG